MKEILDYNKKIKKEKNPILKSNLIGNKTRKYECPSLIEITIFEIIKKIKTQEQLTNIKSQIPQDLFEKLTFNHSSF